jgi:23S rRNA (uracil1939-C5)-methyltransferase
LRYSLANEGLTFEFEPTDFVQINAAVNETLVSRAIELLQVGPQDRVLDLFCGLGNFTLALARRAASVVGVEGDAGLVARARRNAELNGLANASFQVANLFDAEAGQGAFQGGYTRVLLDPPRAGALEVLPRVAATGAPRIVYVSCHPGTLARDVGVLCHDLGYRLQSAGVIDMFPHTNHVESMAVLERAR